MVDGATISRSPIDALGQSAHQTFQTPSPFRFANKSRRNEPQQGSSATKPPASALRHSFNAQTSDVDAGTRPFAHTPSFSRVPHQAGQDDRTQASNDTFLHAYSGSSFRPPTREKDNIDDGSQGDHVGDGFSSGHDHVEKNTNAFKRRRLSTPRDTDVEMLHEATVSIMTADRFLHHAKHSHADRSVNPFTSQLGASTQAPNAGMRPVFLPQPTQRPAETVTPLPEAFSPHRKGRKYVPGGIAETLQGWVMEASHSAQRGVPSTLASWGLPSGTAPDRVMLKLLDIGTSSGSDQPFRTGSATDVDGSLGDEHSSEGLTVNVLFLAQGPRSSLQDENFQRGAMVEVKPPYWDVRVHDRLWMIAVVWTLVS